MDWSTVSDIVGTHRCDERRRYSRCNCRTGKGQKAYNPCQVAVDVMELVQQVANGESTESEVVSKFLHKKTCSVSKSHHTCNHRGCILKEKAIDFIAQQHKKKAA